LNIVRSLIPEEAEEVHNRIEDSLSLVDQTTEKIRDVMANLRPPVLDDYGLVAALRWYAEQFTKRTDIAVTVEGNEPDPRLPQRIESALFRIAQEALTNVAKHAEASHAAVCVEVEDDIMRLVVTDDGIGFDPTQQGENGEGQGWGLLTMTERAEAVGAHCQIESYPDRGTKIILEIGL
jgi:signal transduction histidine kinase